jgi:hypothetical protein
MHESRTLPPTVRDLLFAQDQGRRSPAVGFARLLLHEPPDASGADEDGGWLLIGQPVVASGEGLGFLPSAGPRADLSGGRRTHALASRLLSAVPVRCPLDLPGARELGQAGRDVFGIEVQPLGEITDGAPRVSDEEADDARFAIALPAARGCASGARAPRSRTPHRPGWGGMKL